MKIENKYLELADRHLEKYKMKLAGKVNIKDAIAAMLSYSEEVLGIVIPVIISETCFAVKEWIEKETVIKSKTHPDIEIIDAEIGLVENPKKIMHYLANRLIAHGIILKYDEDNNIS